MNIEAYMQIFMQDGLRKKQLKDICCATVVLLTSWVCFFNSIYSTYAATSASNTKPTNLAAVQVFHRGNGDEVESLDPHKSTSKPSGDILADLYEGLMTYDQDGKLIFGQAASYSVSTDLKTYTFKLKDNLRWSNNDKLTADDFVKGMQRTVDPKVGSVYSDILKPFKNADKIITGKLGIEKLGVTAPDEKTVVIALEKPMPYLLELLTHTTTLPIYQPNLKRYGDQFTKPGLLISNGPFKLTEWIVNSHISVEKNPYYIDAKQVYLDKVVFYPIQQQSTELNRYRAGDLDYTSAIPDVQFNWLKTNLKQELYIAPHLATYYYGFNLDKPPFKDNKNLRKAISLAIDKKIIAEKVLQSGQIATDYLVPSSINNYVNNNSLLMVENEQARLKLAKEYYNKAGYSQENPLVLKLHYNTSEAHKSVAVAIAAMLKKNLGVKTELINQEWKVFIRTRLEHKETEIYRDGWVGDFNDPMTFLDLYTRGNPQNYSTYVNDEYDKLIEQAGMQTDLQTRAEMLSRAEKILLEDAPLIPLYVYVSRHLVKSQIGGFATNILDKTYDRYIYIKNQVA